MEIKYSLLLGSRDKPYITDLDMAVVSTKTVEDKVVSVHYILEGKTIQSIPNSESIDTPTEPGWYAFEGSEWESLPIYKVNGVEYREWQEEWTNEAEEHWHRYELDLFSIFRYEPVLGERFKSVLEVKWVSPGQAISTREYSGRYEGKEPTLGFVKYGWSPSLHDVNTISGKWTKLILPWENK